MDYHQNQAFEGTHFYITFLKLGGKPVSIEQVINEIRKLPLDGLLGFLALLSLESVQTGANFFEPRRQGDYLKLAIVDDFPMSLPRASTIYSPGRIPLTGGHPIFIHEHNIAWLSHLALMYAKEGQITETIEYELRRRICRLLLISNDFLDKPEFKYLITLTQRRSFVSSWLRRGQFNKFPNYLYPWVKLARQYIIMKKLLPNYYPELESKFVNATKGITLELYFKILSAWICHIYFKMSTQKRWLRISTISKDVKAKKDAIKYIISSWVRTPEEYRLRVKEQISNLKSQSDSPIFDYIPLRETPLIEARPDETICPVINFLLEKIEDEPFFIITKYLEEDKKRQGSFHKALGQAYEEYAHNLIEHIAQNDARGHWDFWKNLKGPQGEELADSYLQRGSIGIHFEHKGGRLATKFLIGSGEERVLGPKDEVLKRLDRGEPIEAEEILHKKADEGLITKPMWQQFIHAKNLRQWASEQLGCTPEKIFPIITHYADVRIDEICRVGYLEPLMQAANLYAYNFLESPQWLHISDLEELASLAEKGMLDLELLLTEKAKPQNRAKRFDIFLYDKYKDQKLLLLTSALEKTIRYILRAAHQTFWPYERLN